eukprot:TRINITY_DN12600_c0_g1_i9.p1 TRINITY_DN12600_c0_g1~~TRINITY_DN12600_c0_g1_i9.p1  ORF type:complete len:763 (+),score=152.79 TRINITY_DN12600_c0_g1_i9:65-2353(+)
MSAYGSRGERRLFLAGRGLKDEDIWGDDLEHRFGHAFDEADLSNNELTAKGIAQVRDYLLTCTNLRVLKLFKNRITDSACEDLTALWINLPTLEEVHLSHNCFTGRGLKSMVIAAEARHERQVPLWLRLEHNEIEDVESVIEHLEHNFSVCCRRDEWNCTNRTCRWGCKVHLPHIFRQRNSVAKPWGQGSEDSGGGWHSNNRWDSGGSQSSSQDNSRWVLTARVATDHAGSSRKDGRWQEGGRHDNAAGRWDNGWNRRDSARDRNEGREAAFEQASSHRDHEDRGDHRRVRDRSSRDDHHELRRSRSPRRGGEISHGAVEQRKPAGNQDRYKRNSWQQGSSWQRQEAEPEPSTVRTRHRSEVEHASTRQRHVRRRRVDPQRKVVTADGGHAMQSSSRSVRVASAPRTERRGSNPSHAVVQSRSAEEEQEGHRRPHRPAVRGDGAMPMADAEGIEESYSYYDETEVEMVAASNPARASTTATAASSSTAASSQRQKHAAQASASRSSSGRQEAPARAPPPTPPTLSSAQRQPPPTSSSAQPPPPRASSASPSAGGGGRGGGGGAAASAPAKAAVKGAAKAKAKTASPAAAPVAAKGTAAKAKTAAAAAAAAAPTPSVPPKAEAKVVVRPPKPATPPPGISAMVDIDSDHSSDEEDSPPAGAQQAPAPKPSVDGLEGSDAAQAADALREALPDDQRWEKDLGCSPPSSPAAEEGTLAADGYDAGGPEADPAGALAEDSGVDVEALKERMATLKEQLRVKLTADA